MKPAFRPAPTVLSALILSSIAQASEVELNNMTVTATRSAESALSVPASISRRSGEAVVADRAVTQRDLLNSIAGVRINQTGSTIGHMTSIRLPTGTKPYYLFLQDGIPVQSSGFFNHNGLAFTNFNSAGAVEVLKGAGTALYGSDAVGGTVNILAKSAMQQQGVKGGVEVGSDNFRRFTLTGGVEAGATSAIAIHGSHTESDGFREHSEYDRQELSVNYINDFNDDNTLKLSLNANKFEAEMTSSIRGYDEFRNNPRSAGRNVERVLALGIDPIRKFDYLRLSADWQHQVNDRLDFNVISYVRSNQNRYSATWEGNVSKNDNEEKSLGLLLKGRLSLDKLNIISGLDIEYTDGERNAIQEFDYVTFDDNGNVDVFVPTGTIYDYDVSYRALSPYTRVELAVTERLQIAAGLRYDYNHFNYTNNTADGLYGTEYYRPDSSNDRTFNHLSPKLDIRYALDDQQSLYARYANGFRIPQVSTLYSLKDDERESNFQEEVTDTYEIGYKHHGDQHQLDLAVYYMTINDTIISQEISDDLNININAGKTIHTGIELSLASQWTKEWATQIAYSFSEHEFDDSSEFGDNGQAEAPKHISNVRLVYTPEAVPGLYSVLEWEHVGSSWMDNENTTRYSGHDVANIKVNYDVNEMFTLYGKVNNVTDRLYAERAQLEFGEDYTPAAPRQVFVGLEVKL